MDEFKVKTLDMIPPINRLGFNLPIYPILFSSKEITMKEYENFTNDVIPSILALVVKHEDIAHEKLMRSVKTAKPIRMTYRKL